MSNDLKTRIITTISNITRGKVFKTNDSLKKTMEHPEILKILKDYTSDYWDLFLAVPSVITQISMLITMIVATMIIELKTSSSVEAIIIISLLLVCVVAYYFLKGEMFISTNAINNLSIGAAFIVLIAVMFIGIFFDAISIAVTVADEGEFHEYRQ